MFSLAAGYYQNYLKPPEVSLLLIGVDGAGKTSLLERLKVTKLDHVTTETTNNSDGNNRRQHRQENKQRNSSQNADSLSQMPHDVDDQHDNSRIRRRFKCPAPSAYHRKQLEGDNDEEVFPKCVESIETNKNEDLVYEDSDVEAKNENSSFGNLSTKIGGSNRQEEEIEYDVKPGKTMLPLHLIRPTVGMNLGKLEGYGGRIRVMDLGGAASMRGLWERYYADVHGVVFVVDISPNAAISKLMEARAFYRCMRDDESMVGVPVLIFGNKIDERDMTGEEGGEEEDGMTENTSISDCSESDDKYENSGSLIGDISLTEIEDIFLSPPRGSSSAKSLYLAEEENKGDNTAFFAGSAKTGEGVRISFYWLVEMAKVYAKERQSSQN